MTLVQEKACYIPQARLARIWDTIHILRKHRLTIKELKDRLGVSEKTVYRYLIFIEYMGLGLDKDWGKRYFIADFKCPICDKEH